MSKAHHHPKETLTIGNEKSYFCRIFYSEFLRVKLNRNLGKGRGFLFCYYRLHLIDKKLVPLGKFIPGHLILLSIFII